VKSGAIVGIEAYLLIARRRARLSTFRSPSAFFARWTSGTTMLWNYLRVSCLERDRSNLSMKGRAS